ncbi:hypothetical protein SISSUDRAFT_410538 [Sistotremastrum suecicum HHB10207 ss-3]|uniref:Uncharacterized protein n=1 Tax=Sistotremastrum suecicum HHB10207 ss-3 TaxID=1314776 RepID=A0A165YPA7_9AGAM|nr:hypothetical protein SISSUDRAFT_410538 [Sistotremastrum suecicum HHB10207 ss-3]
MNTTTELSGTAAQGHVEEPERPLSPSTVAPSPTTPKAFEFGSISAEEAPLKPGTIRHFLHTIPLPPPKLREETSASGPPPPRVSSAANLTPAGWRPLQMMSSITKDELRFEVDRFLQEDVPLDLPAGRGSTKRDVKDLLSAYLVSPSEEFVDATNEDVQTDKIRQAFTTNQVFLRDVFPNSCQHEFRVWIPEVSEFPGDMKDPLGPHLFYLQAHWTVWR